MHTALKKMVLKSARARIKSFPLPIVNINNIHIWLTVIFTLLLSASTVASDEKSTDLLKQYTGQKTDRACTVEADEISYDNQTLLSTARGNVVIIWGDNRLTADMVTINDQTMKATANGNVRLKAGNDIIIGTRMDIDLNSQTGTIHNGSIYIQENNFHIRGEKIEKLGENTYSIENAEVTTCDINDPDWVIKGKKIKITIEGYGYVEHAAFWAKKIPVAYTPYLFFPVKLKRQSGFLPPEAGSSSRLGVFYDQPFFWAINDNMDATFYEHYMSLRGHKLGGEFRYMFSEKSKGSLMADYLKDKQIDDGIGNSTEDWGYIDKPDDYLRLNSRRYWFRIAQHQVLPFDFMSKLNLDIVSDQDYLIDFKKGHTGFDATEKYFNEEFGWEFDDYNESIRLNKFGIYRNWDLHSLNIESLWYDDVIKRRRRETDDTLQRLPFVEFDASKQQILGSSFYYDLDSEYNYFYRKDGDRGHRTDIHPRFYLPYRFRNYFTIEPSLGLRETAWYFKPENDTGEDTTHSRELYDFMLELSSEAYRIYDFNNAAGYKLRHSFRPEIKYEYIPDTDHSEYPYFDEIDRIGKINRVTYSIANSLTSRTTRNPIQTKDDYNPDRLDEYVYNRFCYLKLEQSYNIDEAREDDPGRWSHPDERRPFSPIRGRIELYPLKYMNLNADANWDIYEDRFETGNVSVKLTDNRKDKLFVEYRYNRLNNTESIYYDLLFNITDRISLYAEHEQNITNSERIFSSLGFIYRADCWLFDISYSVVESDDRRIEFSISLTGLGKLGSKKKLD